jgi:hypothetical protein
VALLIFMILIRGVDGLTIQLPDKYSAGQDVPFYDLTPKGSGLTSDMKTEEYPSVYLLRHLRVVKQPDPSGIINMKPKR